MNSIVEHKNVVVFHVLDGWQKDTFNNAGWHFSPFTGCQASLFFLLSFFLKEKLKDNMLKDIFTALIRVLFLPYTRSHIPTELLLF